MSAPWVERLRARWGDHPPRIRVECRDCREAGEPWSFGWNCEQCAVECIERHRTLFPLHDISSHGPPVVVDRLTKTLTQRSGW